MSSDNQPPIRIQSEGAPRIDREKQIGVPGAPPMSCPLCARRFSNVLRPPRRWQWKAKMLLVVGLALSVVWAALLWLGFQYATRNQVVIYFNMYSGALAAFVVGLPAYGLGVIAMRMARVVQLRCASCGWQERYFVNAAGKIVNN
jgi:hypothetical protein